MAFEAERTAEGRAADPPRPRGVRRAVVLAGLAGGIAGALLVWITRPGPGGPAPTPSPPARPDPAPVPAPLAASEPPALPPRSAAPPGAEPMPPPTERSEALLGPEGEPTRALLRGALAGAIARQDPSLKLSSDELDAATDALWRLREARLELARLGDDPAQARRRAALVEAIGEATADFTYYVEMSPGELTAREQRDAGLGAPPPVVERAPAPTVER